MIPIVLSFATLRIIWWLLLGILLAGFAIMDGFDLGVAMLLPFVAKRDIERRVVINTIAPVWEGNQVWLILGAGAIFAAWPMLYAVAFSGFYLAMMLILFPLIMRPVGFKFRSKIHDKRWRQFWDTSLFVSGFIPVLVFGIAMGNVIQGTPFYFDADLRMYYTGSFWQLLNPFALLCGVVSVSMLCMHGGLYIAVKCTDDIRARAISYARIAAVLMIISFIAAGIWVAFAIDGYVLVNSVIQDGPSNPLYKTAEKVTGGWLYNYRDYRPLIAAPLLGLFGAIIACISANRGNSKIAFTSSGLAIFGVIATVGVSMFPFILPSSTDPSSSLLVWDASSSRLTLYIMLISIIVFLPLILAYTAWVYRVLRGKITEKSITETSY